MFGERGCSRSRKGIRGTMMSFKSCSKCMLCANISGRRWLVRVLRPQTAYGHRFARGGVLPTQTSPYRYVFTALCSWWKLAASMGEKSTKSAILEKYALPRGCTVVGNIVIPGRYLFSRSAGCGRAWCITQPKTGNVCTVGCTIVSGEFPRSS